MVARSPRRYLVRYFLWPKAREKAKVGRTALENPKVTRARAAQKDHPRVDQARPARVVDFKVIVGHAVSKDIHRETAHREPGKAAQMWWNLHLDKQDGLYA